MHKITILEFFRLCFIVFFLNTIVYQQNTKKMKLEESGLANRSVYLHVLFLFIYNFFHMSDDFFNVTIIAVKKKSHLWINDHIKISGL